MKIEPKLPPFNYAFEQAVLSGAMLEPELAEDLTKILHWQHFYDVRHQQIWKIIEKLVEAGKPCDYLMVANEGSDLEYLGELTTALPTGADCMSYADTLLKLASLRNIIAVTNDLTQEVYREGADPDKLIDLAKDKLSSSLFLSSSESEPLFADDDLDQITNLERFPTQFPELNKLVMPTAGDLIIIGADTNTGKTALALNLAFEYALKGIKTLYFSCEMQRVKLAIRGYAYLRIATKLEMYNAFNKQSPYHSEDKANEIKQRIAAKKPIIEVMKRNLMVRSGRPTMRDIHREIRNCGYPKVIFIDYAQILKTSGHSEMRYLELQSLIDELKDTAMDNKHSCLIYAMSQLTRVKSKDGRTVKTQTREASDIQNTADVLFELNDPNADPNEHKYRPIIDMDLNILKQRDGPKGSIKLVFEGDYQTFKPAGGIS